MHSHDHTDSYKKTLVELVKQVLPESKIYLFGSRARKTHREGADIDIALDNGNPIDFRTICLIKDKIDDSTIPVFVDVIDINNIDEDFKKTIEKGFVLWSN